MDTFTDSIPVPAEHERPPKLQLSDLDLPSRQILFIATGLEQAVPAGFFNILGDRYQAIMQQAEPYDCYGDYSLQAQARAIQHTKVSLFTGRNVVVTQMLNSESEQMQYREAADETNSLVCSLLFRTPAAELVKHMHIEDKEEQERQREKLRLQVATIDWPDEYDDNGVVNLVSFDKRKLLLIIDSTLRRRVAAYEPVVS